MNKSSIKPIVSVNKDGYQRKTIQSRKTLYPLNTKIDKTSHDNLINIKAYYDQITSLKVRPTVIMRRAIAVLADHIEEADPILEQTAILNASHMEDTNA